MKAVPILVITNALALALVVVLLVRQQGIESRLGTQRSAGDRGSVAIDTAALDERINHLEHLLATGARRAALPVESAEPAAIDTITEGATATPGSDDIVGEEGPAPEMRFEPQEMEVFRSKVRKALELNRDEDWVQRVEVRLDNLIEKNRIAVLSPKQKRQVAGHLLDYRRQVPRVFGRLRESGALEGASREERREVVRSEFGRLRTEAQTEMENIVPAADAKTILEDAAADRSLMRGGFDMGASGGGSSRRGRNSNR